MTLDKQQIPAGTLRTASIIVLGFAALLLLFGQGMFQTGSSPVQTARELQAAGLQGTLTDARVNVIRADDGEWHAMHAELAFTGSDGSRHTMETDHFPRYWPPINSAGGWVEDFPTKAELLGQPVTYRLGDSPAVELDSELPALASRGWTFPNYLGLALLVLGVGAAIGGTVSLVRAVRRLNAAKS